MTTLGKILVIVNLVFSLVTGALIIMVYATRTNWATEYNKRVNEIRAAREEAQTAQNATLEERKSWQAEVAKRDRDIKALQGDLAQAKEDIARRQDEISTVAGRSTQASVTSTAAAEETKRLQQEVQGLQDTVAQRDKKLHDYENTVKDVTDRKVQAEIAFRSEHERTVALLDQVASLTKEAERARANRGTATAGASTDTAAAPPPPEDAKGRVLDADAKTGLVTISIGSDAGIARGQVLQVFRTRPEPKYLGTIRIVEADHHAAVGRPATPMRAGAIQKDDEVASRIR